MRRIGVVTQSRSEYSILRPVLKRITADPDLQLVLYVGGMHLSPDFGNTETEIEYPIAERVECLMSSDSPEGTGKSIGLTAMGFAQAFANNKPDILLVTGDRYEMFAAAAAAVPFGIPIVHLDGGALTYGAFDEQWRHAMTKLAHLHFCYTEENAIRVKQMGEEAWRVTMTGSPALDDIRPDKIWKHLDECNLHITGDTLLVVFHSVTTEYEHTEEYINNLLAALLRINQPVIMIMPNSDMGGHIIIKAMRHFAEKYPKLAQAHANLWPDVFRGVMAYCGVMVGNSSAGIMEAPSFHLPVVNIGTRQAGRMHARNVIDVGYSVDNIANGVELASRFYFRNSLDNLVNPYGDGHAAERIVDVLKTTPINEALLIKKFSEGKHDQPI
jgi:UDP-hydrolysing UDP-N-acetyl-D-glucosamine 2-epimerase